MSPWPPARPPTVRHAVSVLVLGIVCLSLILSRLVEGSWLPLFESTPAPAARPSAAATVVAPPTGIPAAAVSSAIPTTPSPTSTAPPPSATPTHSATPTVVPATATSVAPTVTAVLPTAPSPPPTATAAPLPPSPPISSPLVSPPAVPAPAAPTQPPPAVPGGRTVRIIRDGASKPALLREGPTTRARALAEIPPDTVLPVLGEETGDAVVPGMARWYRVSWNGQVGYVYGPLAQ